MVSTTIQSAPPHSLQQVPATRQQTAQRTPKASDHLHNSDPSEYPSPLFTDVTLSDSEDASVSSHDAFYLEKYNDTRTQRPRAQARKPDTSPARKPRPELNVMTSLPASQATVCDDDLKLDHVRAQKVGATNRPKSIVSAKAEHFDASMLSDEPERSAALTKLTGIATAARDRKQKKLPTPIRNDHSATGQVQNRTRQISEPRGNTQNAVMIGIQIPEHEAAMHQQGDNSAITLETPTTPAIVITPAEPTFNRSTDRSLVRNTEPQPAVPSLPVVPSILDGASYNKHASTAAAQAFDERAKHKSQGWWNLALSPMLSRAGTMKINDQIPEVPPLPNSSAPNRTRANTAESQPSPETPRRLGLAGIRQSIWSSWTTEHKQSLNRALSTNTTFPRHTIIEDDDQVSLLRGGEIGAHRMTGGLADEYYHACAIEQFSGQQFFECENHSCAEKWPSFRSIYDRDESQAQGASLKDADDADQTKAVSGAVITTKPELGITGHGRSFSNGSEEDVEFSPHVREAEPATVLQARSVDSRTPPAIHTQRSADASSVENSTAVTEAEKPSDTRAIVLAPPQPMIAEAPTRQQSVRQHKVSAIVPPPASSSLQPIDSPGPISPAAQQTMAAHGDVPMAEMNSTGPSAQMAPIVVHNYYHYPYGEFPKQLMAEAHETGPDSRRASSTVDAEKSMDEKNPGLFSRLKLSLKRRRTDRKEDAEKNDKKTSRKYRCKVALTTAGLLGVIVVALLLATLLKPRGDRTPTQTQWLNLTGYPPMPTGISTIIRPNNVLDNSQCVQPATAWSCGLPPEQQSEISPNSPNQPNFRFEIKFRNGTVASNMTLPSFANTSSISRVMSKRLTNPFADDSFEADPAPPAVADQLFIGNTTDNNTAPFNGEDTPFYMSFIPAFPINPSDFSASNLTATTNSNDGNETTARALSTRQSLDSLLPKPEIDSAGLAAPANLLPNSPFATNQPVRLYNRGLPTEHFGFYMYYDKSIFLTTDVVSNTANDTNSSIIETPDSSNSGAGNPSDASGGSTRRGARSRCTWAQTRFLVQIWTSPEFDGQMLGPVPVIGGTVGVDSSDSPNSAINYTPPGSFPYPTSITLDRHGGNVNKKISYCYAVDGDGMIDEEKGGRFVLEQRGAGGTLINSAPGIVQNADGSFSGGGSDGFDEDDGGIDGGTGGCGCRWQNWQ
ncbi:uncharacterized protein AB675_2695 [Cyphellophora attinorum]|uniref:Glycoprotease family protein n=1 Tax=Cyphellophora attinorum TaxID=1664694 RepID=A0A0N1I0U6_9EURO|nr:uncharacterized protein AB675_2695 [Phialophora attinorum]KPI45260.1 hypothetical protein AB675_2695 [Phialophora attinorum]